ncbi:MAG: mechanosensitive ion channel family protein [Paracoccus sp. (in: a-proteobacteria)]
MNVFRAAVLVFLLLAAQLSAQDAPQQPDYASWEKFAAQAEAALDDSSTSDATIESIRNNAANWRERFQKVQNLNAPRIRTVRDQIDALGPPPAEGKSEAEDVAARRKTLNDQLAKLQAPGITATEAFSRADSIVIRADQVSGMRAAQVLLTLSPSPLLPTSWAAAGSDLVAIARGTGTEMGEVWSNRGEIESVPRLLAYLLAAIALIYGRRLVDRLPQRLGARAEGEARAVIAFIVSLAQILVPMIGLSLLAWALIASGVFEQWITPVLMAIPPAGLAFFSGRWIIMSLFAAKPVAYPTLNLPAAQRRLARISGTGLALALAAYVLMWNAGMPLSGSRQAEKAPLTIPYEVSSAGAGVLHFVLLLIGGFFLFQLANILRRLVRFDGTDSPPYRARVLSAAGQMARILVVITLPLAMFGYITLANALFWPGVKTLGLIGLLILLQDFSTDLYALLRGSREKARESLIPIIVGMILIACSLPFFAMIWGATPSELSDMRDRIMQGASFGGIRLSPGAIIAFLMVFGVGYLLTGWIQSALRNAILPRTGLDQGARTAVVSGVGYIGVALSIMFAVTAAGIDLSNLAIVAGALSVGIGFGLQNIVSNFVSGVILLIERPVSVGDWVEAGGQQGIVQNISVRSTRIRTFDQTDVIVPNSDLISQSVTNWTHGNARGRIIVPVGVAYGTDTRRVEQILREIAEDQPTVLVDPSPAVLFTNFGADSLDFEIRAILSDITGGVGVGSEIRHQIAARFAAEGIEIPFAQRDIWLRNPEALRAGHGETVAEISNLPALKAPSGRLPDPLSVGELPSDGDGGDNS